MSRKSYKRWLIDDSIQIPRTTLFNWKNRRCDNKDSEGEDNNILENSFYGLDNDDDILENVCTDELPMDNDECLSSTGTEYEKPWDPRKSFIVEEDPIYDGSPVTKCSAWLLTLAYIVRYGLTGDAIDDLLQLLNVLVPGCVPGTKYFVEKTIMPTKSTQDHPPHFILHYYCPSCFSKLTKKNEECHNCGYHSNTDPDSFFIELPMREQLRSIMEEYNMYRIDREMVDSEQISDIHTGKRYQSHKIFFSNADNISLTFSTDGVPLFKSSGLQAWPLTCYVNELQYDIRSRCPVLCGLWIDTNKPDINFYLKPFTEMCTSLYEDGFKWRDLEGVAHTSRVIPLVCSCDTVARPMLQYTKQFNGYFGCGFCLNEGVYLKDKQVMVHPTSHPMPSLRTHSSTLEHAQQSLNTEQSVYGMKGVSCLFLLPQFDVIKNFVPDTMHSVLLGIVRQFVTLWLDSKYSKEQFYIGTKIDLLDNKLKLIECPTEIRRQTRSLKQRKFWKATEWRAFLLFYSVIILEDILPATYYNHWLLLVFSFHMLLDHTLPTKQLLSVELALLKFSNSIEQLYGLQHCSYNSHLLTHTVSAVKDWGLPWAWSCFSFESYYGVLQKKFHGTQHVALQIAKSFMSERRLSLLAKEFLDGNVEDVNNYFIHLTSLSVITKNSTEIIEYCRVFGKPDIRNDLTLAYTKSLDNVSPSHIQSCKVESYGRFIFKGITYCTEAYCKKFRRKNCYVTIDFNGETIFGCIKLFGKCHLNCTCSIQQNCCCETIIIAFIEPYFPIRQVMFDTYVQENLTKNISKVNINSNQIVAFASSQINSKCILYPIENTDTAYIYRLPRFDNE